MQMICAPFLVLVSLGPEFQRKEQNVLSRIEDQVSSFMFMEMVFSLPEEKELYWQRE